jgi:hypothetical protein
MPASTPPLASVLGAVALVVVVGSAHPAHAEDVTGDAELRAELARQGAAIAELKAQLDAETTRQDEEDTRRKEREALEANKPPLLDRLGLHFSGFTQVDWVIHNQSSQNESNGSTGLLLNQDRFELRREHLRLDIDQGLVLGRVEVDANPTPGPHVRPIDAEVSLRWPAKPDDAKRLPQVMATLGLMRIPFGYEVQELDYVRPFLERATVLQAFFPGEFDLGARLGANYRFVDAMIALMNGDPIGNKVFPDLAPVSAKDVVGRLGIDVSIVHGVRFQAGASAVTGTGFHAGTPATKPQLVWQDQNGDGLVEPNEIVAVGGAPATPSQTFHRFAIGGDARLLVKVPLLGELAIRAEAVAGQNIDRGVEVADPVGAGHDLRELGWTLGATQEVTRWAMIGLRYDTYNPDSDASQQQALNLVPIDRSYSTMALMAMARYHDSARLLLEYDINRNPLGVAADGSPTTLADNTLTLRAQLVY